MMRILWFSWKDIANPDAGGAEVVTHNILSRMAKNGWDVILLTAGYKNCRKEESIGGYKIIRTGCRYSIYWAAYRYYKKHLKNWANIIVEEINTMPFFTSMYAKKEKRFLFLHQLCREIWFFQMPLPFSLIGYLMEPFYLRLLSKSKAITVSQSSAKDLIRHGFSSKRIFLIPEAIELKPVNSLSIKRNQNPVVLSLGAIRPMKRTLDQIKAFEIAKQGMPQLKMKIAGSGSGKYFDKVFGYIKKSQFNSDIEYLGKVKDEVKLKLMKESDVILVTSVKEGWGLIVTEANSQGTPAIVYNVDGLRDSTINGKTGLVTAKNSPQELARGIIKLLNDSKLYNQCRERAWNWSKEMNFDATYIKFMEILERF